MIIKIMKLMLISLSDLYTFSKFCEIILIMTFKKRKLWIGPVRLFVVFSCHVSFKPVHDIDIIEASNPAVLDLSLSGVCSFIIKFRLSVFLSEIPPRPLHLLNFHFEIVVISHTFIRNNAERAQIPFTHFLLDVKPCLTVVNITTRILMLMQSTDSQIFPVKLVLVRV